MAKKPTRYPRKLRQKLEKIATERDEREAERKHNGLDPSFRTLWEDFLSGEDMHMLHTKLDHDRGRVTSRITLIPDFPMERVFVEPPWHKGRASE